MTAPAPAPLRILMLEDSRFDAELVEVAVRASHPQAVLRVVADEAGFVHALQAQAFDLILSDYEVPGYGGPQALAQALAQAPRTPFILVSGVIGEENAVDMLKRGATDYVSKNRLSRLAVVIERALREVAERDARERAERQLCEADAIYARVVDALSGYAVILLDRGGAIRDWNRGARLIFGMTREEALGSPLSRLFTEADQAAGVAEAELEIARQRGSANDDRWLRRADGSLLRAEGVLTALRQPGADGAADQAGDITGFCKILRDVTAAYETAAALRDAKEEAERANLAKDRFLAMLSHELRTPLSPIASAAQLLEQQAIVPLQYQSLLPMIRRNVALESRLIEDLLELPALAEGQVTLKKAPVDLRALLGAVVDMVADTLRDKQITLTTRWDATRCVVDGDPARLQQVLWNIVRNAVKFTPRGGHIELHADDEADWLRLRCSDDGIGIDEAAQKKIFCAFEQADAGVGKQFGGLGLGLAIARGLVDAHHGTLEVSSPGLGRGATFTLKLRSVEADLAPGRATPAPAPIAATQAPIRLLLVEDNEDAALAMMLSFEYFGYRVTHAPTLRKALEAARNAAFDVVLTDLGLPDGNGITLGEALRDRVPLIALSGFGSADDLRRTAEAGFAEHLVKPVDPQDIHATVMKVLARNAP